MARKAREKSSTGIYAVMLRGNGKIFGTKKMREMFTQTAEKYLGSGLMGIRLFDTHADMLVRESEKGISLDMKPLVTSFARTYNKTYETDGKVFADRFKSVPVESAELEAECAEYLNGGAKASPYAAGAPRRAGKPVPKKASEPVPRKNAEKPEREPAPEPPKPKKKKSLPSWLL